MQNFCFLRVFPALQMFFSIIVLKWGIKWTRLWKSSRTFEFSIFSFKWFLFEPQKYFVASNSRFIFIFLAYGHIHNVVSKLVKVVNLDVKNDNVVSTLSNVVNISTKIDNVDSTLFNVVTFKVDVKNNDPILVWRFPTSRRHTNLTMLLKNVEMFIGDMLKD